MWNPLKHGHATRVVSQASTAIREASAALLGVVILLGMGRPTQLQGQAVTASADGAAVSAATSVPSKPLVSDYIIGPEDVLAVNVWKEPEVSRTLPVRPDGKISLPLVGDLLASGRTPAELQSDIKQQLRTYFTSPEVTVLVQEAKSHKFNIVGEINKPGSYVLSNSMTVLDAIAVAGGLKDFAKASKIYVLRVSPDGSRLRLPFNYKKVIQGGDLKQNVELATRDTIVVP